MPIKFSQRIMWLKMSNTNHDPAVILSYYLENILAHGGMHACVLNNLMCLVIDIIMHDNVCLGCPCVVRMDQGTVLIGTVQCALREDGDDRFSGINSVRYGSSPANIVGFHLKKYIMFRPP